MAQLALYRAWRPMDFDAVVAQQQVVQTLKQAVKNGEFGHAYLFCGTRGTGKTSLAKILARAVNCLDPHEGNPCNRCAMCLGILNNTLPDVQEIDAASNNSVDNVRRIIDEIVFLPVLAKFKVYIVDEVHMLSPGAFNALLKTLEEPPAHAIFILATTEPHRIPATILSRCQRFDFRRIPDEEIAQRLLEIARDEKITIETDALQQIATLGDGALRDAISLLDQSRLSFPEGITADKVRSLVGSVNKLFYADLAEALVKGHVDRLLLMVATVVAEGREIARFSAELTGFFRDILVAKVAPATPSLISGSAEEKARISDLSGHFSQASLNRIIMDLSALIQELRWADQPRTSLEVCLLKLCGLTQARATSESPAPAPASAARVPEKAPAPIEQTARAQSEPVKPLKEAETAREPEPVPPPLPEEEEWEAELEPAVQPEPVAQIKKTQSTSEPEKLTLASPLSLLSPEELALLSPELLAQTEAEYKQVQQQELSPPPSARGEDGSYDPARLERLWKETLETLSVEEPFLFLFAREGEARPVKTGLELHFAERTRHHYNVLSSVQGHEVFVSWEKTCEPDKIPLKLVSHFAELNESPPKQPEDDWMKRIRKVAEELNVPFEDEFEN